MSENKQNANLGCGTLILVALIVLIFSKGSDDEVKRKIDVMDAKLTRIVEHLDISSAAPFATESIDEAAITNMVNHVK